jgi:hypothetical protein
MGSGKNLFRIPDPGPRVKKAPDPGSRSATLVFGPPGSGSVSQRGTGMDQDPAPDPSIIKKKSKKNFYSYYDFFLFFFLRKMM